jgi:monovalent cation/hydrogen antiporter
VCWPWCLAFLFTAAYLIRLLDRRPEQRLLRVSNRTRVVSGLAGFRGAVSLAVALSVPVTLTSGGPFPGRDLIVFVTFGVIVVTLAGQGLLLPTVIRWARLPRDTSVEAEQHLAETTAAEDALAVLPRLAAQLGTDPEITERLRLEYANHLRVLHAGDDGATDEAALRHDEQDTALRLALLARKRATALGLRDERRIDDTALRRVQARLDIEEARLTGREPAD